MARASRQVRKIRRIKRERTIAFRLLRFVEGQRDQARNIAMVLEKELKARDNPPADEATMPALTITKLDEAPVE